MSSPSRNLPTISPRTNLQQSTASMHQNPTPYASQTQKIKNKSLKSFQKQQKMPLSKQMERKQRKEKQIARVVNNEVLFVLHKDDKNPTNAEEHRYIHSSQNRGNIVPTDDDLAYEYSQGYSLEEEMYGVSMQHQQQMTEEDLSPNSPSNQMQPDQYTTEDEQSTTRRIQILNEQLREQEELHMPPDLRAKQLENEQFKIKIPGLDLIENRVERLALIKLAHGPVHVEVVRSLLDLAQTYILTDACDSAIPHLEKALKLCYTLLQKDPDVYAKECESLTTLSMLTLAVAHIKMGQIERAETLVLKSQRLNDDIHEDEDDQSNFAIQMILGQIYASMDKIEAAESSFTAAWEIKEQLDPDHPLLGMVYTELGRLYRDVGRLKQSVEMFERARQIAETNRGSHDIDVAHLCYILCDLYSEMGDFEQALQVGQNAFDIVQKYAISHDRLYTKAFVVWKLHIQVAHACTLIHNQQYKEAAPLLHEVIEMDESQDPGSFLSNLQKAFCLKMLGSVWAVLGAWHESHNCFLKSAHLYGKCKGLNHKETQRLVHRLARIRLEMEQQER
uniref:MalT-like TPR region domain-containing protein n=1 Tax=Percolomonas cosmopolitus TaxID=63605 RepID=A0A7S1PI17_9EUKA